MRFFRLTVAYDGTDYVGWQIQPNGPSIQQRLQDAWHRVTGEAVEIVGSGRTDSGVHALGQVCSVETSTSLDGPTLCRALNANLPGDIRVRSVEVAPDGFHAIRDAVSKTYRYQIQYGPMPHVLLPRHYWYVRGSLDVDRMRQGAQCLLGRHDFASFQAAGADRVSTVRIISELEILPKRFDGHAALWVRVTADGFLYNMVRNIVGTLVLIGKRRKPVEWIVEVLAARDRQCAGPTAPPHGLLLWRVDYTHAGDV
jgi:tRNA pseudouridine38-40 synthase